MEKIKLETQPKDKIVNFNLLKEMSMPQMIRAGYQRKEVELLFIKLQEAGFGTYTPGHAGKTGCAKFVANEKCPNKYVIAFRVKKLHKDYAGEPETNKPLTIEHDDGTIEVITKNPLSIIEKILLTKRRPKHIPIRDGNGYIASIAEGYLFVDKIINGGFGSITEALDDIWEDVKDKVSAKGTKYMSKKDEVESSLMGKHYYKLEG